MKNCHIILFILSFMVFAAIVPEGTATVITRHVLSPGDVEGDMVYSDELITNGGTLAVNKNLGFDSQNQSANTYNLQTEKVLTYESQNGAHLTGEEEYILDTAGSYKPDSNGIIHCIFTSDKNSWLPAFCNTVHTKATLININSARVSEQGNLRMVGEEMTPAELNYRIAISPDSGNGESYAKGAVQTMFTGSILEGRDNSTNLSATSRWSDKAAASGSITSFLKNYEYKSGFRF